MNSNHPLNPIIGPTLDRLALSARPGAQSGNAGNVSELKNATEEFEGMFVSYLLKVMRSTVEPADPEAETSAGKDIYFQMFDNEIAQNIAKTRSLGLGDMLFEQLSNRENALHSLPRPTEGPETELPGETQPADSDALKPIAGEI